MSERHDITLRQADDGPNPPGLLRQIVGALKKLLPTGVKAGGEYVKGKGEQQIARAGEIKSKIIKNIGQYENERQRLIQEREEARRKAEVEAEQNKQRHVERLKELEIELLKAKSEAFEAVADRLEELQKIGVQVEVKVVSKAAKDLLEGV